MDFKPDWTIHYVQDHDCEKCGKHDEQQNTMYHNTDCSYIANVHTHGLNKYGHSEICIVLDLGMEVCGRVLNALGQRIACNYERFEEGYNDTVLANGYKVKFMRFGNNDTLYLILPDANNNLPEDFGCKIPYCYQIPYAKMINKGEY